MSDILDDPASIPLFEEDPQALLAMEPSMPMHAYMMHGSDPQTYAEANMKAMEADSVRADTEETGSLTDDQDSNSSLATGGKSVSPYAYSSLADQGELEWKDIVTFQGSSLSRHLFITLCRRPRNILPPAAPPWPQRCPPSVNPFSVVGYPHWAQFFYVPPPVMNVVPRSSTPNRGGHPKVTTPRFAFSCAPSFLMQGLAKGASGMARLSRARLALPTQLFGASASNYKFALCLPSIGRKRLRHRDIVMALRGTATYMEWLANFMHSLTPARLNPLDP